MNRYKEIEKALIESNGVIWDDHNGGYESKLMGCAALVAGDKIHAVGLHDADFFSLNRLYLKDGKVHLSTESVGGVLFPVNFKDVWDCINDYNEKQINNPFSCGTLENPMGLHPVPITVVTLSLDEWEERMKANGTTVEEAVDHVGEEPRNPVIKEIIAAPGTPGKVMLERKDAGWELDGQPLPPPLTEKQLETVQRLIDGGMSPEEANSRVRGITRPHSLNVDFLPGDEDEIQEAYYRELLAKKATEPGVEATVRTDVDLSNPVVVNKL